MSEYCYSTIITIHASEVAKQCIVLVASSMGLYVCVSVSCLCRTENLLMMIVDVNMCRKPLK